MGWVGTFVVARVSIDGRTKCARSPGETTSARDVVSPGDRTPLHIPTSPAPTRTKPPPRHVCKNPTRVSHTLSGHPLRGRGNAVITAPTADHAVEQNTPPTADYAVEQNTPPTRRGRFIAPTADLSALAGCSAIRIIHLMNHA